MKEKSILKYKYNNITKTIALSIIAVGVILDQVFKFLAERYLQGRASIPVIPRVLQLTYVRNTGAAFGIFKGKRILLILMVTIVVGIFLYLIFSEKIQNRFVIIVFSMVVSGGIGNLIDRIVRGYVVDYLDIGPLFTFPVFNFADCLVVVGCILLMIYVLFFLKDEEELKDSVEDSKIHTVQPSSETEKCQCKEHDFEESSHENTTL